VKTKIDKIKLFKRLVIVILILGCIGFIIANRLVKSYGYSSVFDVLQTTINNSKLAKRVDPIDLHINLSKTDFEFIKQKRQVALDRGLQINEGDNYVNCELVIDGEKIKGELRLKGHMTDHLEGDKWSFRVKTKKNVMGMYRFSLQHPGTRNFTFEWIYHQLLKHEGVIYLKYDFINVTLNDKDLGIYAVEEHFGQHVLERNNKPKGAIIRWNPNLYWEGRIDGYQNIYVSEEYSDYKSSFPEPYDKSKVIKDKELLENYSIAASRLEKFRRAELSTSEVFDVQKMAKFHAIIDLVGGQHSLDWSDVKFYYNSETKKIEPVGYESFSLRKTESIAGQQIFIGTDKVQYSYHAQLFADPIFFEAYIENLERIADETYISEFFREIKVELDQKKGILAKEWPYRKFDLDGYYKNVELIRHNLQLPKPFHAFSQSNNKDSIVVSLAAVSDFPIEIIGLKKKSKLIKLNHKYILSPKPRETVINYVNLTFYGDFGKNKNLIILAKIPGSKTTFEIELAKYPAYKKEMNSILKIDTLNERLDTNIFRISKTDVVLKNKVTRLKSSVTIPDNFTLHITPNQKVILEADLIINGKLNSVGLENQRIKLETTKDGRCIIYGEFKAINTQFTGEGTFESHKAKLNFYNCSFYDITKVFLKCNQSFVNFNTCLSGNVNQLVASNECDIMIKSCQFINGNLLASNYGSIVKIERTIIKKYKHLANLDYQSTCRIFKSNFYNIDTLFRLKNTSNIILFGGEVVDFGMGFLVEPNSEKISGESKYKVFSTITKNFNSIDNKL